MEESLNHIECYLEIVSKLCHLTEMFYKSELKLTFMKMKASIT